MARKKVVLTLRMGTRASALALAQSSMMARLLERANKGLSIMMVPISTTGDFITDRPLAQFGGAGVFVKELEAALLDKKIDFAVHSLKDMPTKQPRGLVLGAVAGREDPRDVAITRGGVKLVDLPPGSVIGSGSQRRRAQLKAYWPHLEFAEIRGNVDTRIRKVEQGEFAGTILARAGLKRLNLLKKATQTLPFSIMLPAPGQGALALECRSSDAKTKRMLAKLHDAGVDACIRAERAALQALGGGCHLPLGALAVIKEHRIGKKKQQRIALQAFLGLPDGSIGVREEDAGSVSQPEKLGRKVAKALRELGGNEILKKLAK